MFQAVARGAFSFTASIVVPARRYVPINRNIEPICERKIKRNHNPPDALACGT
jgi:hypothetical protein